VEGPVAGVKPFKVRERLGIEEDPLYSWLSELSHPRFAGLQTTGFQIVREASGDNEPASVRVYIGGLPLELPHVLNAAGFPGNALSMLVMTMDHCPMKVEVARSWATLVREVSEILFPGYEALNEELVKHDKNGR
jgi:hypothetical protein